MVWAGAARLPNKGGDTRGQRSGDVREMSAGRQNRVVAWGVLLMVALALGGCSSTIADLPVVGTPADAPARPKEAGAYLPVHDLPPDRDEAVIPPKERAKIESELIAARDRQASTVNAQNGAAK
jgi:hypothetical protein